MGKMYEDTMPLIKAAISNKIPDGRVMSCLSEKEVYEVVHQILQVLEEDAQVLDNKEMEDHLRLLIYQFEDLDKK